jgi:hypothetical protein
MSSDIAISTVSWIRTSAEREIVLKTIQALSALSVPVIIVDAGSAPDDQQAIRKIPNVIFYEEKGGLTKQLYKSQISAAKYGESIFYLQTDKLNFVADYALPMITKYRQLKSRGILIPTRTPASIKTYPMYQQTQEAFLNFFMSQFVGIAEDYYAGPKIYPAALVKYLGELKEEIGWGIEAYYYALAKRLNLPFDFLSCFIQSPTDVDDPENTKIYRLKITQWQIQGLIQGNSVDL